MIHFRHVAVIRLEEGVFRISDLKLLADSTLHKSGWSNAFAPIVAIVP